MYWFARLASCALSLCALFIQGCSHGGTSTSSTGASGQTTVPQSTAQSTSQATTSTSNVGQGGQWSGYETAVNYAAQHGTVQYNVTYQPNTVLFNPPDVESALRGVSADGSTYMLDSGSSLSNKLKPGSIMLLAGIAIRKVQSVQTEGSNIAVSTTDADITDAIKEGHISWSVPMDLSQAAISQLPAQPHALLEDLFADRAQADDEEGGECGSPWSFEGTLGPTDYDLCFTTAPSRLNISAKFKLQYLGELIQAVGEGYIENLTSLGNMDIHDGQVAQMTSGVRELHGHLDWNWVGQNTGTGPISGLDQSFKIRIPGAFIEYPLVIGPLPLVLEASAAVLIHPAFTGKNEITHGKYTIDVQLSGNSVSYTAGEPQSEGDVEGSETIDPDYAVFGVRAMGFVAALEMPRLEAALAILTPLDLLTVKSVPAYNQAAKFFGQHTHSNAAGMLEKIEEYAHPVKPYAFIDLVTSTGTFTNGAMTSTLVGLPPCQRVGLVFTVNGGFGVKVNFKNPFAKLPTALTLGKVPSQATAEVFEAAKPIYTYKKTIWKNGLKCPGD
jgi:hypothetical protein